MFYQQQAPRVKLSLAPPSIIAKHEVGQAAGTVSQASGMNRP